MEHSLTSSFVILLFEARFLFIGSKSTLFSLLSLLLLSSIFSSLLFSFSDFLFISSLLSFFSSFFLSSRFSPFCSFSSIFSPFNSIFIKLYLNIFYLLPSLSEFNFVLLLLSSTKSFSFTNVASFFEGKQQDYIYIFIK